MMRKSTAPPTPPSAEGTLHFDASGRRIPMAEFCNAKPTAYTMSVAEAGAYLAKLQKWMQSEEVTA
jgi:hypothetical protein